MSKYRGNQNPFSLQLGQLTHEQPGCVRQPQHSTEPRTLSRLQYDINNGLEQCQHRDSIRRIQFVLGLLSKKRGALLLRASLSRETLPNFGLGKRAMGEFPIVPHMGSA